MIENPHNLFMKINNHHAYVIEGDFDQVVLDIKSSIGEGISVMDIFEYFFESFSIDDARMIKELDIKSPVQGDKKYIILKLNSITREAQNALLKVFEDPSLSSRFFVVVSSANIFIETILSRVEVLRHESFGPKKEIFDAEEFLKSKKAKRLDIVASLLKDLEAGKINKQDLMHFLVSIRNKVENSILDKGSYDQKLLSVLSSLKFIRDKSGSAKLLLERVCLC